MVHLMFTLHRTQPVQEYRAERQWPISTGQPVLGFNRLFYEPTASNRLEPEVAKNVTEGLGFSKDRSWHPALSDPSIPVFTFSQ